MPAARRQRIQMVLLGESGMRQPAIAAAMGISLGTAHVAYDHGGINALKPNGGRKHENMTLAEEQALRARFARAAGASGPFARWGEQFQQAIQVYQKIHGDTVNGNKIEIIYRDDGGPDPARVKQLAEGLILRDKVKFLAGFVFTPNALAVADLVTESQTPTVIFNASTAMVIRKSPYFVRTSHTIPQVARPIAEWAHANGIKRVVTAVSDYAPGFDAEQAFSRIFKAA